MPLLTLYGASPADAATFARVARDAFYEAYVETSDPANMAVHLAREFGEVQQAAELGDPATTVLAACEPDGEWAGFASVRSGSSIPCVPGTAPIELARFYMRRRWYGQGAAALVMRAVLDHAVTDGHDAIWLQVWEQNLRAQRFYEKCGFAPVGTNPFRFGDRLERDIVMCRAP